MDTRVLLVLFIVSTCWCCNARELLTANHFNRNDESFSVLQTNNKLSEGESHLVEEVSKNNELCTLCEDFASEALNYLSENKTQTEIISILHKSCSKIPTIKQQIEIIELLLKACNSVEGYAKKCKRLVFEYGPLILVNAEQFLEKNDVCIALHACASTVIGAEQEALARAQHSAS
ncbi:prosaposin-like isoform X2 [Olea europaea var. sylvestris]|uniref:prosaposin-like isoform X2 n=1 Tax=Olea europaea var. sylvestris TaxID=158386 RepID=UPI000C1D58BB|nr:prosaposin-like isoform X2 [Olea europaea var. sylvestris]XP_022877874.1 prosaposin-like isoform X2 [Olea europaea var. sylvestris]